MSQFSASYHLITSNQNDAVELLKRANLHGYVFPEKKGIVTFVIQRDQMSEFTCCEQLIAHNKTAFVFFVSAEDHGWFYEIYDQSICVAQYASSFNEDGLMEGFDYEHPELFTPHEDVSHFIYDGSFKMEEAKELLKHSVNFDKKIATIQKSKLIVDAQKGLANEVTLRLKEEAFTADEFAEEFGIFFYDWISYHYLQLEVGEELIFDYGKFGKYPLLVV